MAAKRRARRSRPDDSTELGRDGGNEGSDEETAVSAEPKETPLKQQQPSPSPARSAPPRGGVALKTKTASRHAKKPPPASQEEEEEEEEAGDSGEASPPRDPLPDAAGGGGRGVTRKRGPTPPQQGEERPEKRPARSDGEIAAASALQQLWKVALTKPTSPPSSSSPDIAQEDEHHGRDREMAEQEQSGTSPPQDEHGAREVERQGKQKITEHDHAGNTSPPHDKDMHSAHGEEQQEKEAANQQHVDGTLPPIDNHSAPSTKPRSSETEKKPAVERAWSCDDELKILKALVEHAQSHNGALPESSLLLANLTFDKTDVTEDKLTGKIRKLRRRHNKFLLQGCPSDGFSRRLFKLFEILWGQVDEDERVERVEVEPTSRDFSVLSNLYPHLAKEVKSYAETHSSGDLIMAMFMNIGDEKARDLDAKCKKQHIEAFKLELGQATLTNELLSTLSMTTKITDPYQATPCKRRAEKPKEPLDEEYLRRSKRVAGMTEGFKDKPNAYKVFNPKPLAMTPAPNSPGPHHTRDIVEGIAAGFLQIHPRD